jgi:hypothetical protein
MYRFLIILLLFTVNLLADIKSTTGEIKFNTQSDNQAEMTLNETGLGIEITPLAKLHINGNAIVSGQLFVGGTSGSSNLNVNGSLGFEVQAVNSNTSISTTSMVMVDTSSDNITVTLPSASQANARVFKIKKTSALNQLWVDASDNIDSYDSRIELTSPDSGYSYTELISNGSEWFILSQSSDLLNVVAADNLIGWWKLDQVSGNITSDSSSQNNHGNVLNVAAANLSVSGKINKTVDFDGTNDYVETDDYNLVTSDFSISAWINSRNVTARQPIVEEDLANSAGVMFELRSSAITLWEGYTALNSIGALSNDIWYHVVGTYDGTTAKIYIDGVLNNSAGRTFGSTTSENLHIGWGEWNAGANSFYFNGFIDDVRLYDRALSLDEVEAIYNLGH